MHVGVFPIIIKAVLSKIAETNIKNTINNSIETYIQTWREIKTKKTCVIRFVPLCAFPPAQVLMQLGPKWGTSFNLQAVSYLSSDFWSLFRVHAHVRAFRVTVPVCACQWWFECVCVRAHARVARPPLRCLLWVWRLADMERTVERMTMRRYYQCPVFR